jgi:hypothetical protein
MCMGLFSREIGSKLFEEMHTPESIQIVIPRSEAPRNLLSARRQIYSSGQNPADAPTQSMFLF